jgi:hypothetical protein
VIVGKVCLLALAALQLGTASPSAHMSKPTANTSCDVTATFSWQGYSTAAKEVIKMTDEATHFAVNESHAAKASGKLTFVVPAVANPTKTTIESVGQLYNGKGARLAKATNSASLDCIFG